MYPENRYNVNFDICAVLLAGMILSLFLTESERSRQKNQMLIVVTSLMGIASLFEVIAVNMRNNPSSFDYPLAFVSNLISHLAYNLVPYFLTLFIMNISGVIHKLTKKNLLLFSLPALITFVFMVVPPLEKQIYIIGNNGMSYTHGSLFFILYAESIFYVAYSLFLIIRYKNTMGRHYRFLAFYIAGSALAMVLQLLYPYLKASKFLQTLLLLGGCTRLDFETEQVDRETNMVNRYGFVEDAGALFGAGYQTSVLALKLMNINYCEVSFGIKNTSGYLREAGTWLKKTFGGRDVSLYYCGNGTFSMIVFNRQEGQMQKIAEKIQERFDESWSYKNMDVRFPYQIWITDIPEKASTLEQLLITVDQEADPKLGTGKIFYADEKAGESRMLEIEKAIRNGLENHTFKVFYQPIFDTASGKIHSCEALSRLFEDSPVKFGVEEMIHVAEKTGLIVELGKYMLEEVCRFLATAHPEQFGIDFIEVNLSTVQMMDEDLTEQLLSILNRYEIPPSRLNLEITESAFVYNKKAMDHTIQKLKNAGFSFALDDFGTGYSNYDYVISYPFSIIKIDKSILWAADSSQQNERILQHTIEMVKDLNRKIVVEGVETDTHKAKLTAAGTDYLQGYYFSKPVDEASFMNYTKSFNQINTSEPS